MKARLLVVLAGLALASSVELSAQKVEDVSRWLSAPILDPKEPQLDVQVYTASRVPVVPTFRSATEWQSYAADLRQRVLNEVVFRGVARSWRTAQRRLESTGVIDGGSYLVKKFRFEIIPDLWVPAVVYEPKDLKRKVPVVLNVMGHEKDGIATPYIQVRCINLAKKGLIAVNVEWLGRGQLSWDDYNHYKIAQIDLTGTSGLALFYLHLERTLDLVMRHEFVDAERIAVTGLSGGGWQTTYLSALDPRVKLAVPVAGHSSFVTRSQMPQMDLGDSEQTPSDMARVADYLHMSALMAPRPLMLVHNANDNCCFRADYAMGPLVQATQQVYRLFGAEDKVRYFVNHEQGHNYGRTTREELYRFLKEEFQGDWEVKEIDSESEVRNAQMLTSALPTNNVTFSSVAKRLAAGLPRTPGTKADLADIVKFKPLDVDAREVSVERTAAGEVRRWRMRMGRAWSVPVTEMGNASASETVVVVSDEGRGRSGAQVGALLSQGKRVLAVDPFYFGESKIAARDHLFAILLASLGERPLGLQASQLAAVAKWSRSRNGQSVSIEAFGPRTSLIAAVAAALDAESISRARLHGSWRSLNQVLDQNLTAETHPEVFCFGLLEKFDIGLIAKLGRATVLVD